jgi:hypothetical protein
MYSAECRLQSILLLCSGALLAFSYGAVVVALMSVGAYAYMQHRAATDLTARVDAETADLASHAKLPG